MASDANSGESFKTGFVLGAIVGAAVGLLLAPKSGHEMRADLLEQSEALRARAEELAARARDQIGPAVESARERTGPAVDAARDRIGSLSARVTRRASAEEDDRPGDQNDDKA